MADRDSERSRSSDSLDRIAEDLRQLRFAAGGVSYAEIVRRIARYRESCGVPPEAARPARTTVYDVFRSGRTRINAQLVGEIARSLGSDDESVSEWEKRCIRASQKLESARPPTQPKDVSSADGAVSEPTPVSSDHKPRVPFWLIVALLVGCTLLNCLGYAAVGLLKLPLYLDMAGTAIAAIVLGPWYGAFVGILTNVAGVAIHGSMALPFGLVNVTGALLWGYGAKSAIFNRTVSRYFALNMIVALSCTVTAFTLLYFVFEGGTGHAGDSLTENFASLGEPLVVAVLQANLITSIADKLLAGFASLVLCEQLRKVSLPAFSEPSTLRFYRSSHSAELRPQTAVYAMIRFHIVRANHIISTMFYDYREQLRSKTYLLVS